MIIITIIKPCSQATSTSSCMWRRWGSSPAQSLHSGYRRVGPSPGRKQLVKKVTEILKTTLKPRRGGREQLVTNLSSFFFCACSILLMSRESNLRPNLLKASDNSPEGLDGGMACLVTTRVVCVRLKQNILRSNLSFSFRKCKKILTMRSSIPMSCSDPEMRMLNSLLLNILNQSNPITSAKPFLKSWVQ